MYTPFSFIRIPSDTQKILRKNFSLTYKKRIPGYPHIISFSPRERGFRMIYLPAFADEVRSG
jgi:hypothetical protein